MPSDQVFVRIDAGAQHATYPTMVREFFANFNTDIDVPESTHRHKTWVRLPTLSTEEVEPPAALLNASSVENLENKMKATGNRVPSVSTVDDDEGYHDQASPATLPAPTTSLDISIQLAQLLVAQT
ncbi:hypothetical protein Adt_14305 [Abeliophyllum distichum]|uniref:Uncharacterized protein n=1 Tax=Abeliophyllum distichum TaxID=126358 RepID=A0ABD1TZZ9_9LAMI